jgi:two-component system phosphate regulon response regulator OmpR
MLTARGDVTDRIVGLEIGADDYLSKPFEPRELVARIQALIRRSCVTIKRTDIRVFDNLTINAGNRSCLLDGNDCKLTSMEFEILDFFIERPNRVIDRDTLMEHLKGMDCQAFDRSIDIAISRLRQKIGDDPKIPRFFKTIRGTGYVFIAQELTS